MDLKIALSGDLPARCSDALAALAPELGMVPAPEGLAATACAAANANWLDGPLMKFSKVNS